MTTHDPTHADDEATEALRAELHETRRLVVELETETRALRGELERIRSSAAGRLVTRLQATARRIAPVGTARQRRLHTVARSAVVLVEDGPRQLLHQLRQVRHPAEVGGAEETPEGRERQYAAWLSRHAIDASARDRMRRVEETWPATPLISVVLPVYNPEVSWLEAAVESVMQQVYASWELCIADDASSREGIRALLSRYASDPRITVTFSPKHRGIAATTNAALGLARGEFVAFLDHDDVLRPHALHAMVAYLQAHESADLIYSDEDMILPGGEYGDPKFKPDYSPEMLLSWNYITHLVMIRRSLVESLGGLRGDFEGSQDHDLLLRAVEHARHVGHVADVLYGWRVVPGSAALSADQKPLARESGRRAVEQAVHRRGFSGRIEFGASPGLYNVRYEVVGTPSVGILIPTRDRVGLLRTCIGSIERKSTYQNYSITIINNGSRSAETLEYLRRSPHRVIDVDAPFNFSSLINAAARSVDAEHLLLLNNDTSVITPNWIEAMLEHSQHVDVGAVGARLVFSDGRAQHEGIVVGRLHVAANVETRWRVVREVSAVTGACLMSRRIVFEELGGLDEGLVEAFNDVDYCLRARARGYRVVYTPLAELVHREGASRGRRIPSDDEARFAARWGDKTELEDPYLNTNVLWPNPLRLRVN